MSVELTGEKYISRTVKEKRGQLAVEEHVKKGGHGWMNKHGYIALLNRMLTTAHNPKAL